MDTTKRQHYERLARNLLDANGLTAVPFKWDNARARFGSCQWERRRGTVTIRRITLSRHLTPLRTEAEVRDTLLHEIAHALAGRSEGHGAKWRSIARRLGADPRATHQAPAGTVALAKYTMTCGRCGEAIPVQRRPSKPVETYSHRGCGGRMTNLVQHR